MIAVIWARARGIFFIILLIMVVFLSAEVAWLKFLSEKIQNKLSSAEVRTERLSDALQQQQTLLASQLEMAGIYNEASLMTDSYLKDLRTHEDETQKIFHDAMEYLPPARQCVPDSVSYRLYEYARRLRAGPSSPASTHANQARANPSSPSCLLTYGQSVRWVYGLLTALDEANYRLKEITHVENNIHALSDTSARKSIK